MPRKLRKTASRASSRAFAQKAAKVAAKRPTTLPADDVPLRIVHDAAFRDDVHRQHASTEKARRLLGFEATTTLDEMLDEVIPWVAEAIARDLI